ncbi:serpentine type 7TM GPCR chemoreceptor str domain-containing protein [Ditylenchus destructor]|uniref:Serpentine type 7TM GPCR chemoreceptor str domain-containing protein n=1 Tax=Ditylenchus destructor TaxID=166010 RepID=A0AAD4N799_9BILA|nr:serpentine type 7TM GPCR chemoreceptor str domain-containing protein [Ditylenchus destructor]
MLRILLIPIVLAAWYATSLSGSVLKPDQPVSRSYSDCLSLLDNNIWLDADRRISLCFYTDEHNVLLQFYMVSTIIGDILIYMIVAGFAVCINRKLNEQTYRLTERTAKMQRQLNIVLAVQALVPLFVAIIPCGAIVILWFYKINIPGAGVIISMAFSWIPVMSPLSTIFLVTSYRRKVLKFLMKSRIEPLSKSLTGTSAAQRASGTAEIYTATNIA